MKERTYWTNFFFAKIVSPFSFYAIIEMITNFLQNMRFLDALCETPFDAISFFNLKN